MYHRIASVKPAGGLFIEAEFQNGAVKRFDVAPLLSLHPEFCALRDLPGLFSLVYVDAGGYGIAWNENLDLNAEDIWSDGIPVSAP